MHEMWCGADTLGELVWHVLTPDRTSTLCGIEKREQPGGRQQTDKHCVPCMRTFQDGMESR